MKKILIVDDEKNIVRIIKFMLEREGYKISTAFDGIEALNIVRREQFDLIILDIMMPNLSGEDFLRIRKSDKNLNKIKVIMLTAKKTEETKNECIELGCDEFFNKPFSIEEISPVIKKLLAAENL